LTNVVAIAAGFSHSLGLKSDGTVVSWGDNSYGQANTPTDLAGVVAITGGWFHSLALKSDGTVAGWGAGMTNSGSAPDFGQNIPPASLTNAVTIAAGQYHSLALKADGTVTAWGGNAFGQASVPPGLTNVVAIAAGENFSVALTSGGRVVAWGDNSGNQCEIPFGNVVAIAAGDSYCLARTADGRIVTWGSRTNVPAGLGIPAAAIISVNDGTTETNASKVAGQDGNVSINGAGIGPLVVYGGANGLAVLANGRVNVSSTNTSGVDIPANSISMTNYGFGTTIPDYTTQGTSSALFDIGRLIAVANATPGGYAPSGNNHFTNMSTFITAADLHQSNSPMQGVIVIDVATNDPHLNGLTTAFLPTGINVEGCLVFNFTGSGWNSTTIKFVIDTPININPPNLSGLVATNSATYTTGYPPAYTDSTKNPDNIDISGAGYQNFTAADDLPALVNTIGVVDLHNSLNISGVLYTPSYMEIENKHHGDTQYIKGEVIMGNGIYLEDTTTATTVLTRNAGRSALTISACSSNSLALRADGTVAGWGNPSASSPSLSNVTMVAAGGNHGLALVGNGAPTIPGPVTLANLGMGANGFSFSVLTENGRVYRTEYKDSLSNSAWTPMPLAAGNGGILTFVDSTATNSQRFYRVCRW
jgi:alpha-tubulin suppressor-like RCC1 family protein